MGIMNADALKNNLGNPARGNLFEVIIPNPRGDGNTDDLKLRCMSASLPRRGVETFNLPFKQTAGVEYPGKLVYDHTWDLTFFEGEDAKSYKAFYSWCQLMIDDYAGTGVDDAALKADMYLTLLTRSDGLPYNTIKLIGCFPKEMKAVDLNWDNKSDYRLSVTINFDRFEVVS